MTGSTFCGRKVRCTRNDSSATARVSAGGAAPAAVRGSPWRAWGYSGVPGVRWEVYPGGYCAGCIPLSAVYRPSSFLLPVHGSSCPLLGRGSSQSPSVGPGLFGRPRRISSGPHRRPAGSGGAFARCLFPGPRRPRDLFFNSFMRSEEASRPLFFNSSEGPRRPRDLFSNSSEGPRRPRGLFFTKL